ncbi:MAG TPA: cell wall-binding repeat-containing protein [Solirubrobacterales bacterium]|nr:cell wall-binding repeat-containing protein [Solirubrobacterales bacterium]
MSADRPINADVPATDPSAPEPTEPEKAAAKAESKPTEKPTPAKATTPPAKARPPETPKPAPPPPKPKRRRQPIPGALKGIAALVVIAIIFIVAAIVGGSGGTKSDSESAGPAPAPAPAADSAPAEQEESQSTEALGYPAFATGNTTRVGGSDAATNAAGVALAVFPSTTTAQRPGAVTLVGEDDWAGAIAASVLMAAPVRAPILVSTADDLPDPTAEALAALDPQGDKTTGGGAVFAIGDVATPDGSKTRIVKSGNAAATAAAVSELRDNLFGSAPAHILVAPSDAPELAMPAAAWAARSGDPVLFAAGDVLPEATLAVLERHKKVPVYVLGPPSAISAKALAAIAKVSTSVKRVAGKDAVANAIAFARYADGNFGWNVNDPGHGFVLVRDNSPLDAAAAAPLSASGTWGPLLLTDSATTLPPELREYFLDVKPGYTTNPTRAFYNHVWVIGDQEAIDVNQQAEVNELAELAKIGGGA